MQVFISHASADDAIATRIHDALQTVGIDAWVDHLNLKPPVANFRDGLHQALKDCDAGLVVLTPNALQRPEIDSEWNYILATGRPLFVAKIDDIPLGDINPRLLLVQPTPLYPDWDTGIAELVAVMRGEPATPQAPVGTRHAVSVVSKPITRTQDRNRERMLQKVRAFWVEGVLEKSLYAEARLELGMETKPDAVENPWDTVLQHVEYGDYTLPSGTRIIDVFHSMNGELLILGEPGGGKTTTLLELARDLIDNALEDESQPIPVVFNLSSWAEERKSLGEWLIDELNTKYQVPEKIAEEWVDKTSLILLLDGLDEVRREHRNACVNAINSFRSNHIIDLVVCSRIGDYELLANKLKLQGAIRLQPLTLEQIHNYFSTFGDELDAVQFLLKSDEPLQEIVQSPLMLSIIALAYSGVSVNALQKLNSVEARRKHLFDNYVRRMFSRRANTTDYSPEKTLHYLSWLARQMVRFGHTIFYIELLQPEWLENWRQRGVFLLASPGIFFHFTKAEILAGIIVIISGVITFFSLIVRGGVDTLIALCILPPWSFYCIGLMFVLPASGWLGRWVARRSRFHLPSRNSFFSWQYLRSRWRYLVSSTLVNAMFIFGGALLLFEGGVSYIAALPGIILLFLIIQMFVVAIVGSEMRQIDLINMKSGEALLSMSFRDRVTYSVLHLTFWFIGNFPFRHLHFLDYCAERVFLRKVGGGYIFIHRLLMEYFASLNDDQQSPKPDTPQ